MRRARTHAARVVLTILAAGLVYLSVTVHVEVAHGGILMRSHHPVVALLIADAILVVVLALASLTALVYLIRWAVGK